MTIEPAPDEIYQRRNALTIGRNWYTDATPVISSRVSITDRGYDRRQGALRFDYEGISDGSITLVSNWTETVEGSMDHQDSVPRLLEGLTTVVRRVFHGSASVQHLTCSDGERQQYYLVFPPETDLDEDEVGELMRGKSEEFFAALEQFTC